MRLDRFSDDVMTRICIEIIRTLDCWSPHDPSRMPDAEADIDESRIRCWLKGGLWHPAFTPETGLPASPGDQRKLLIGSGAQGRNWTQTRFAESVSY